MLESGHEFQTNRYRELKQKREELKDEMIEKLKKICKANVDMIDGKVLHKNNLAVTFFSNTGNSKIEVVTMPSEHPLLPIFKYANSLVNNSITLRDSLRLIFYPTYIGEKTNLTNIPDTVTSLIDCLEKFAEEHRPFSVTAPRTNPFAEASFNLICEFAAKTGTKPLTEILSQFENSVT